MAEYTEQQLIDMVVGKQPKARAKFFEKAALDVNASKEAGRRVYNPVVYIQLYQPGVTDNISYPAQESDIREYREEYQFFLNNRQGTNRAVSIDIIPNLGIIHRQELVDMGLSSIQRLAEAEMVPDHLDYARQSAIILNQVLKEQEHGKKADRESALGRGPEAVHEAHRQEHPDAVGRPVFPPSVGGRRDPVAEGRSEAGRLNGHYSGQGAQAPEGISDSWSIGFKFYPQ